ncbi:uncharacterized protein LOC142220503 [Haematobia irritans]|uniref:uncharacterized protein LOC142220503 n=1 Tax=Haematobia irritans TaxID=7368 RepID=UPI003F509155
MRMLNIFAPTLSFTKHLTNNGHTRQYSSLVEIVQNNRPYNYGNPGSSDVTLRHFYKSSWSNEAKRKDLLKREGFGVRGKDELNVTSILYIPSKNYNSHDQSVAKFILLKQTYKNGIMESQHGTIWDIFVKGGQLNNHEKLITMFKKSSHKLESKVSAKEKLDTTILTRNLEDSANIISINNIDKTCFSKNKTDICKTQPSCFGRKVHEIKIESSNPNKPPKYLAPDPNIIQKAHELKIDRPNSSQSTTCLALVPYIGRNSRELQISKSHGSESTTDLTLIPYFDQKAEQFVRKRNPCSLFPLKFEDKISPNKAITCKTQILLRSHPLSQLIASRLYSTTHKRNAVIIKRHICGDKSPVKHYTSPFVMELLGGHEFPLSCDAYSKALVEAAKRRAALKKTGPVKRLKDCIPHSHLIAKCPKNPMETKDSTKIPGNAKIDPQTLKPILMRKSDTGDVQKDMSKGGNVKGKSSNPCKKSEAKPAKSGPCANIPHEYKPKCNADPCGKSKKKSQNPCSKQQGAKKSESGGKNPGATKENKQSDPCGKNNTVEGAKKKPDSCAKKSSDPCAKKSSDPCAKKSSDPCAKKSSDPCAKKSSDLCAKKSSDPCAKKKTDPCAKKSSDPCAKKKPDPCAKKSSDSKKKTDPCAKKKSDPCTKKSTESVSKKIPKKCESGVKGKSKSNPIGQKKEPPKKSTACLKKENKILDTSKKTNTTVARTKVPTKKSLCGDAKKSKVIDKSSSPCGKCPCTEKKNSSESKGKKATNPCNNDPCSKKNTTKSNSCGKDPCSKKKSSSNPCDKKSNKKSDPCSKKQQSPCGQKPKDTKPKCQPKGGNSSSKKHFSTSAVASENSWIKRSKQSLNNNFSCFGFSHRYKSTTTKDSNKKMDLGERMKCKSLNIKLPSTRHNIPSRKDGLRICYPKYDLECPRKLCKNPKETACSAYAFLRETSGNKRNTSK